MKVRFTSQAVVPAAAMLGAAMMAALVGCSSNSGQPVDSSSVSTSAAASTPTKTAAAAQQSEAETIAIGTSGVRCFAGRTTVACVTIDQKGLMVEGKHAFSFVRTDDPGGGVEPGFAPGQHVQTIAVGDLVFLDTSGCAPAGSKEPNVFTANCTALTISSAVTAANSAHIILGVISKASAEGLTVCATDTVFDIPIPPPAEAGAAVFRPGAGQQLNAGQSIRAKNYWSFALKGDTLTISSPGGATNVRV
ncbi:hypothetical protein SRL2020028_60880 [Mycobacterium kiyosense]|uniref:Lipoprotein n=1 Tax=Mycobacterium kiyosense TaxID=2871094 RepID=A0AA37Q6A1_9MYCO|nr:hypothetical protein [Mycobacterium kiyosense]GLB86832.1 hypothetical protein SRL2020028_60880 [Mycobacterium kiyosense]